MKTIVTYVLAFAAFWSAMSAECVRLGFDSLPSAQGWVYVAGGSPDPLETSVFSVNGAALIQNTIGLGLNHHHAYYALSNSVPTNQPFTVTFRARVLESKSQEGFKVYAKSEVGSVYLILNTNALSIRLGTGERSIESTQQVSLNGTQFHVYRIESMPDRTVQVFVDDVLAIEGLPAESDNNEVSFGWSSSADSGSRVEITQFEFCQRRGPTVSASVSCIDVCWDSLSNRIYQVQYRSTLTTNQWANLGAPVQGNGATNCVTDQVGVPRRFYRVQEMSPEFN